MASKSPFLKKATTVAKSAEASPKKRHGLGRDLNSLLTGSAMPAMPTPLKVEKVEKVEPVENVQQPQPSQPTQTPQPLQPTQSSQPTQPTQGLMELPILDIERSPYQPRRDFKEEELRELAESLKNNGLVQPPTVRKNSQGKYELIAGERRLRAALLAGWRKIRVTLIEADDLTAAAMTTTENLQREDLNPIEEAISYKTLQDSFGLTQQDVAERVGKARATVANSLRLLELPDEVKSMLETKLLSVGHAKILLSLDDEKTRTLFARDCVNDQLTVLALQRKVDRFKSPVPDAPRGVPDLTSSYVRNLQDAMRRFLGCAVRVRSGITHANGRHVKGMVEIDFYDNDDLDRIIRMMGVKVE